MMHRELPPDVWTPKRVKEVLAEAVKWVRRSTGPVGPSGIRGSMPAYIPTLEDHLEEGWGLPEVAGDDEPDDRKLELPVTPERADYLMRSLSWVAVYLINDNHRGSGLMVSRWMAHSGGKGSGGFNAAIRRAGVSRTHAYRLRDRGLSLIAQGLTKDGVRYERD